MCCNFTMRGSKVNDFALIPAVSIVITPEKPFSRIHMPDMDDRFIKYIMSDLVTERTFFYHAALYILG